MKQPGTRAVGGRVRALRALLCASVAALVVSDSPARPAGAQNQPMETGSPIQVNVNLAIVEATVKTKSGQVIGNLTKDDFRISENGVPQTIEHFSRGQLPLAVALVVDLSTSIQPFLRPLRFATQTALKTLKAEDQVALFTFTGRVEQRVALTHEKRAIADEIATFQAEGSTNINGALYEAANYLREAAPAARRVIILVSDNVPTDEGGVSPSQDENAILEADAALYSLKVPGDNPMAAKMAAKLGPLVNVPKLAGETGGEVFDVEQEGSLYLAFQALIDRLKTRYTLGYYPTNPSHDGSFRAVDVTLAPARGAKGHDYIILTPKGYYAR